MINQPIVKEHVTPEDIKAFKETMIAEYRKIPWPKEIIDREIELIQQGLDSLYIHLIQVGTDPVYMVDLETM